MRKFFTVILLILIFFLIYFLQTNIFSSYTLGGIAPNIFIIFVLFVGLYTNQALGISFGVIGGLILDFIYGRVIGTTAIMLCVIGYLGSYFDKNFSKDKISPIVRYRNNCDISSSDNINSTYDFIVNNQKEMNLNHFENDYMSFRPVINQFIDSEPVFLLPNLNHCFLWEK